MLPVRPASPEKEEVDVPTYSYKCKKCKKRFEEILSLREYAEEKEEVPEVRQPGRRALDLFTPKTSRKS